MMYNRTVKWYLCHGVSVYVLFSVHKSASPKTKLLISVGNRDNVNNNLSVNSLQGTIPLVPGTSFALHYCHKRVLRNSDGSALAWCKAGPSTNLGSAPWRFCPLNLQLWRYGDGPMLWMNDFKIKRSIQKKSGIRPPNLYCVKIISPGMGFFQSESSTGNAPKGTCSAPVFFFHRVAIPF